MPIEVPSIDLQHIEKAPLVLALAQVRFSTLLAIESPEQVSVFQEQEHMKSRYRLEGPFSTHQLVLQLGPDQARHDPIDKPGSQTLWRFRHRTNHWVVSLTSNSLAIEAFPPYQDFSDFSNELRDVLTSFTSVFQPTEQIRFGLRYVNQVPLNKKPRAKRFDRINERLLGAIGSELGVDVARSLSEIQFTQKDGVFVLRHGVVEVEAGLSADGPVPYSSPETTFLLDFDYFTEVVEEFSVNSLTSRALRYHTLIESVFAWSTSDHYRKELGMKAKAS